MEIKKKENDGFKDEIIAKLKENAKTLSKQIESKINSGDIGTVKNLTQALGNTLKIIEEYEYKLMFSKYSTTDEKGRKENRVSVWEQNAEGDIRNHQSFRVVDDYKNGFEKGLEVGKEITIQGVLDENITNKIKEIIETSFGEHMKKLFQKK